MPDQWQSQILLRVMKKATVIYVSEMDDAIIEKMHMIPAKDVGQALEKAKAVLKNSNPTVVAIPDGISVIVKEEASE